MKNIFLSVSLSILLTTTGCQKNKSTSKGYNYEAHRKDNAARVKETRKRNKNTRSLLNHKGKSVKTPKPELP